MPLTTHLLAILAASAPGPSPAAPTPDRAPISDGTPAATVVPASDEPGAGAAAATSNGTPTGTVAPPSVRERAQQRYDAGMAHYRDRNFAAAIEEFRLGFTLDARPEILFAQAQAERLSGDCETALDHYRAFLAMGPTPAQTEAAQIVISRCQEILATAAADLGSEAAIPPVTVGPADKTAADAPRADLVRPPPAAPASSHWYQDPWANAMAGAAVLAAGASTALMISASGAEADAIGAATYDEHDRHAARADGRSSWSLGAGVVGLALAGGAIARWVWLSR